jgi:hypothetical protein
MALHHLRLRTQATIDAIELVPYHEGVIASDVGGGDNRIEYGRVRVRHIFQYSGGRCRVRTLCEAR